MPTFAAITACRACGRSPLRPVMSLGRQPLANALRPEADLGRPEPTYPLDLAFCPACALVQITETVPPEVLFADYAYFSSVADEAVRRAGELARRLVADRRLGPGSLVVEAASNDGYLLRHYLDAGVPALGVEPAANVAAVARGRGVPTMDAFFGPAAAAEIGPRADVVHAHNVLAHVADLGGFVDAIRDTLKPGGLAVVETPTVVDLVDTSAFDTIYHEHLCYYSLTSLRSLLAGHGLAVVGVERLAIHGGSLRVFAMRAAEGPTISEDVGELLEAEDAWGVRRFETYAALAGRAETLRADLLALLADLKARGLSIAAYGASAKGSTLLNYCGLGRETLDFVADRGPAKQGRYTPGSSLPILPPSALLDRMPDVTLLLTWNFADEILAQQAEYRRRGGRFLVPIPAPRLV